MNADDIWDRMAAERDQPLPTLESEQSHDDSLSLPESLSGENDLVYSWTDADLDEARITLGGAKNVYERLEAAFLGPLSELPQQELSENDRNIAWRTIQLHLSRLIDLYNEMQRAVRVLSHNSGNKEANDDTLLDDSQSLLRKIKRKITLVQNDLKEE